MKYIKGFIKITTNILIIMGMYYFIRWSGLRGFTGILIGMTVVALIFFTKNPLVQFLLNRDKYMQMYRDELLGETKDEKK